MELRPYQRAALEGARAKLREGARAVLIVMPTGVGKTIVFAHAAKMAVERSGRVLVLAHRTELLEQAHRKLLAVAPEIERNGVRRSLRVHIEQANARATSIADVVVGSVQTMKGARLTRFPRDFFKLLIVDEAHHATAATYRAILDHFAGARVLGVTATPDRADEAKLGEVFQAVGFTYEMRAAIDDGYLVPLRVRSVVVEALDLARVQSRGGDFVESELVEALASDPVLRGIADPLPALAGDRPTIVFVAGVANAHRLAGMLNAQRPECAAALDGTTDAHVRRATIRSFERREFQFLINVGLFTEGFDAPLVSCVAIARPTQSRALQCQMVGRGTRPLAGVIDARVDGSARVAAIAGSAKSDLVVIDFTTNTAKHRLANPLDVLGGRPAVSDRAAHLLMRDPSLTAIAALDLAEVDVTRDEERAIDDGYLEFATKWRRFRLNIDLAEVRDIDRRELGGATVDLVSVRARLVDLGVGIERAKSLTTGQAVVLERELLRRVRSGLCALRQAYQLLRFNQNPNVTTREAGALLAPYYRGAARRRSHA